MLVVIIGGIVIVISIHYSKQYDIRNIEAAAISEKILNCFAPNGIVDEKYFITDSLSLCLNLDAEENFVNVTLIRENPSQQSIFFGKEIIRTYCEAKKEGTKGKNLPECFEKSYDVLFNNEPAKLNIFVGILKIEKNV